MDKLVRLARLSLLIEAAGGQVEGRKKLHKLAYLCQRTGTDLGHGFAFHMYGVYSPSLPHDVEAARAWEYVTETVDPKAGKYDIALGAKGKHHEQEADSPNPAGLTLVRALAGESAAVLEVLTTIVYLWDAGYREPKLGAKLLELKGHLESLVPRAFELAQRHALTETSSP